MESKKNSDGPFAHNRERMPSHEVPSLSKSNELLSDKEFYDKMQSRGSDSVDIPRSSSMSLVFCASNSEELAAHLRELSEKASYLLQMFTDEHLDDVDKTVPREGRRFIQDWLNESYDKSMYHIRKTESLLDLLGNYLGRD